MKTFLNILNYSVAAVGSALWIFMATEPDLQLTGTVLLGCQIGIAVGFWSLINLTQEQRDKMRGGPREGVHWFWFLFWLVFFFPALVITFLIHFNRKNAATRRAILEAGKSNTQSKPSQ